jgi:hypothetical protein
MTEYNKMAHGTYTVSGGTLGVSAPNVKIINLPFRPGYVELRNLTQITTPANHGIPFAYWDFSASITTGGVTYDTMVQRFNATPVLTTDIVSVGGGISTFSGGLSLQYGAQQGHNLGAITDFSMTAANPVVVTTVGNHGLSSGDVVVFQNLKQTSTTGMQQMAGIAFTVTVTGATTFSVPWNGSGSNYTAFNTATATGNVGTYRKVLYPYLYAPGVSIISNITNGTTTTIDTTNAHNLVVGQEIAIRIPTISGSPTVWGPTQFNSLPNTTTPGSPIYAYVVSVTDYNTVVVNINSSSYSAFSANLPFSSVPGASYAQIVAVGDVNTGGVQISSGSALYPPPYTTQIGTTTTNSINGPAILGSFFNNTSQGFIVGNGASKTDTSSWVGGSSGDIMEWRAIAHDLIYTS